jgi:hypothetical protein
LFKTRHAKIRRNPTFIYSKREQFQIDLVDLAKWSRSNRNVKFLLVSVDSWSRHLFVSPLKNKSTQQVLQGFKSILQQAKDKPKSICSDHERAVKSRSFQEFCQQQNIALQFPSNLQHCPIIERANLSLKRLIFKYMAHFNTKQYLPALDKIVASYNRRYNRSIGCSPIQAEKPEYALVVAYNLEKNVFMPSILKQRKKPQFRVNQRVRISTDRSTFSRSWDRYFRVHVYKISSINTRKHKITYKIVDPEDGIVLNGTFMENELMNAEP